MSSYCENCGAPRSAGAEFCGRCGRPFDSALAAPPDDSPRLVITEGQANMPFAVLSGGPLTIGRAESNMLVLSDPDVSRQHALIEPEAGQWILHDLNSRNGTFIHDQPVTREVLCPGDQIRMGNTLLAFSAPPAAQPRRQPTPRSAAERPAPQAAPERRKRRSGLWLAAGLVALALVAAGAVALLQQERPPESGWEPAVPTSPEPELTPLAAQVLQPSSEAQTVAAAEGISVTVPGGLLAGAEELAISAMADPPAGSSEVFETGRVYEISLGEMHRFAQPITIEVKYDPGKLNSEMSADAQVRLASWNPATGAWSLLPTIVDEARQVAVARTYHLSAIGDRYLNSVGYRHYEPRTEPRDQLPHFRLIWDSRILDMAMELPERRPGTFEYQNKLVKVRTIEEYAWYAGMEAERTYAIYRDKGLLGPEKAKIDLIVGKFGSSPQRPLDDHTHPFGGAIFIMNDHGTLADLRHVVSHEMFHLAHMQQAGPLAYNPISIEGWVFGSDPIYWFTDASAEYAACRIAWQDIPSDPGLPKPFCNMGEGIKARFLRQTLQYGVNSNAGDPDNMHSYHASWFLDYLINGQPGVGEPRYGDHVARFNSIWGAIMQQLSQTPGTVDALDVLRQWAGRVEFNQAYQDFAAYFLFNTNSPMPGNPKNTVPDGAWGDQQQILLAAETEIKSNPIKLPYRYSAALWKVVVQVDPAKGSRQVVVKADGDLPENVYLNVYLSGVDDQRADHGKWGGPKEACHLPSSDECIIPVSEPKVVLHIVAANASDYTTEVVVKVSAAPDEPARPAPGGSTGNCICADGLPLTCDPAWENTTDGYAMQVMLWEQTELQGCYRDCLAKCGCDPMDPDLDCSHRCICGR